MNYRHAFHAGNFADVMKHVLLVRILAHMRRKETPFRAVDTHAGIGLYDLASDEAERTGEWRGGVGRLDEPFSPEVEDLIAPYRAVLAAVRARHGNAYPGSPLVIRELLRPQDRAVFVELHPEDGAALARRFRRDPLAKVLRLDGWTALHALIPPKERRGVVLVDPPFEEPGELSRLARELAKAFRKWSTGIFLGWYPIKDPAAVEEPAANLAAAAPGKALRIELMIDSPADPDRLNGCGLFVLNPPWTLQAEAEAILPALASRLARGSYGAFRCETLGVAA
ncbi:MAG TPA: 23S rRNA (adenine(2030)-N(6))-methyltransferase RlmJ [Beijerinckiaceae bacterium]